MERIEISTRNKYNEDSSFPGPATALYETMLFHCQENLVAMFTFHLLFRPPIKKRGWTALDPSSLL